jgi:hypothetical protein
METTALLTDNKLSQDEAGAAEKRRARYPTKPANRNLGEMPSFEDITHANYSDLVPAPVAARRKAASGASQIEPPRGLFTRCASVHVDFHAHRHFENLRCFPGHLSLP